MVLYENIAIIKIDLPAAELMSSIRGEFSIQPVVSKFWGNGDFLWFKCDLSVIFTPETWIHHGSLKMWTARSSSRLLSCQVTQQTATLCYGVLLGFAPIEAFLTGQAMGFWEKACFLKANHHPEIWTEPIIDIYIYIYIYIYDICIICSQQTLTSVKQSGPTIGKKKRD